MNHETITLLKYSATNTYLIEGERGAILFDTGWAGTFSAFCAELGRTQKQLKNISFILISHFHPDHCGIAQEIADKGPVILIPELQKTFLHASDVIFAKERGSGHIPIREENVRVIALEESRKMFAELGIAGELLYTPGHSEDSISLWLDQGALFVGDLNPLYELELHRGTQIEESWKRLLARKPRQVFYGHAKTAVLEPGNAFCANSETSATEPVNAFCANGKTSATESGHPFLEYDETEESRADSQAKQYDMVARIMKMIDKKKKPEQIARKTGADPSFVEDVTRMYLTHPGVSVQGILDRIEIKNR